jgi:hypothetical protein
MVETTILTAAVAEALDSGEVCGIGDTYRIIEFHLVTMI